MVAIINCKENFWDARRPKLRFRTTFRKSSRKPIQQKAKLKTKIDKFLIVNSKYPNAMAIIMVTNIDIMKLMPPMVGVPLFLLCQEGPICNIDCPNFNLRNIGISTAVRRADIRNEIIITVNDIVIIVLQVLL